MIPLLLTIHALVAVAMVITILLQRSEGGALGLGGGGGVSSLMSGRGAANALSRMTVILAGIFIATSLALALIAKANRTGGSVIAPITSGLPGGRPLTVLPGAPAAPGSGPLTPGSSPATPAPFVPSAIPQPTPATPAPSSSAPASSTPTTPGPAAPAASGQPTPSSAPPAPGH